MYVAGRPKKEAMIRDGYSGGRGDTASLPGYRVSQCVSVQQCGHVVVTSSVNVSCDRSRR